jgi:ABC-type uncharacterized transport system permease subunit
MVYSSKKRRLALVQNFSFLAFFVGSLVVLDTFPIEMKQIVSPETFETTYNNTSTHNLKITIDVYIN